MRSKQTKKDRTIDQANNIIGSLQGDIQKLNRSKKKLEERIKSLRHTLKKQTALQRKTSQQLNTIKKSASWKTGYVLVKAFVEPGKNTLLLPYRLLKILFNHIKREKFSPETFQSKDLSPAKHDVLVSENDIPPARQTDQFFVREKINNRNLKELRVASVVDEFTYNCFKPECDLFQLTPENWQQEMESFRPDLLFVEAAWRGKDDLWIRKIVTTAPEIRALLDWCKEKGIPTAFWGKEDPSDFATFCNTAKLFDFIFTTDLDCIGKYKETIPSAQVALLPFAAQPRIHNPIEQFSRKDLFCFAGAYYPHFPDRKKDFERLYETLSAIKGVDIYDRNYRDDRHLFIFPEKYKASILGNLPSDQIDKAYKGYRYALNLNSIKTSGSMFARRVFELLASNTVVVSNYSKGIHSFFGDLVISSDDEKVVTKRLDPLVNDAIYNQKFRLLGLRKVLAEHTYEDRFRYMTNRIWGLESGGLPHICVIAKAGNAHELGLILSSFKRQSYKNKSLVVVLENSFAVSRPEDNRVTLYDYETAGKKTIGDIVEKDFVTGFVSCDYYGPNYIVDIMLATRYSSSPVIGKGAWYSEYDEGFKLNDDKAIYTYVDKLPLRSCAFRSTLKEKITLELFVEQLLTNNMYHEKCLAIDTFNYCRNYTGVMCPAVDDLQEISCGSPLAEIRESITS